MVIYFSLTKGLCMDANKSQYMTFQKPIRGYTGHDYNSFNVVSQSWA